MSAKPTAALVVVLAFIGLFAAGAAAAPGLTELVSLRSNGTQGDGISGRVSAPAVSTDGVVVAFDSEATNLVGGDTNGALDVFVRDRASGRTERVSVSSKGKQGNSGSAGPMLSGDGRFVTFSSGAANLVSGDTNGRSDIFVHDRMTGETTRVSVAADGAQGDNNSIGTAAISADGRFVAFTSDASNLVPQTAPGRHIYVKDRSTGAIERVSVDSHGDPAQGFVAASPAISGDGRFVAFASSASNLVKRDTNGKTDVFGRGVERRQLPPRPERRRPLCRIRLRGVEPRPRRHERRARCLRPRLAHGCDGARQRRQRRRRGERSERRPGNPRRVSLRGQDQRRRSPGRVRLDRDEPRRRRHEHLRAVLQRHRR